MSIKQTISLHLSLLICLFLTIAAHSSPCVFGSVKFLGTTPENIDPLPVYYDGCRVENTIIAHTKTIKFDLPLIKGQNAFYLLVTEKTVPLAKTDVQDGTIVNTFQCHIVPQGQTYKLFRLTLVSEALVNPKSTIQITHSWHVQEMQLGLDGKIPDQTIIIHYVPELVDHITGGNSLELPTLYVRTKPTDNITATRERIKKTQLNAIDANTTHGSIKKAVSRPNAKTVVVAFST